MKHRIFKIYISAGFAIIVSCIIVLSASLISMQRSFDNELYANVIRLHIPANSDSREDQIQKMRVRDIIVPVVSQLTADAADAAGAKQILEENIAELQKSVQAEILRGGYNYPAEVTLCKEYYPVRYYDGFVFPSGVYDSLKVVLGEGKGKNWWCVLYPSVCTALASDVKDNLSDAGISGNTVSVICNDSNTTQFSLYILEMYQNLKQYFNNAGGTNA